MNKVLLREATCAIVRHEAEENLADDAGDLVALDHALGFGGGSLRIDRVLFQQFDLLAHHAARCVDLLNGKVDRHYRILAERAEKPGARRQVADPDDVGGSGARKIAGAEIPDTSAMPPTLLQQATARELIAV